MSACRRFEDEGLLRLEQGLPLDDHFTTCPDCLAERAAYERLREEIAKAHEGIDGIEGIEPPPGWQAGVWAAIERRKRRRLRDWWLLVPAAAAAVLVAVLLLKPPVRTVTQLALAVEVETGAGPVRRGHEAHPGDRLRLRATTGEASHAELRIYRNDRVLVLRCSNEPPCRRGQRGQLEAELVLPSIGSYQSLLMTSDRPLPESGAGLDADVATARTAGAQTTMGDEIEVR